MIRNGHKNSSSGSFHLNAGLTMMNIANYSTLNFME